MDNNNNQNKPNSVPSVGEISEIFGLAAKAADSTPKNEVVAEAIEKSDIPAEHVASDEITEEVKKYSQSQNRLARGAKVLLPYLAVFGIGIFLYYFYFADFSFNQIFKPSTEVAGIAKQQNIDELYSQEKEKFETWMKQYYFTVSNNEILDPNKDLSGNGLTNFQKYIVGLNPKVYDSLGQGKADSEYLKENISPLTGNNLSDSDKQLIENYIDLDIAVNKKNYPKTLDTWASVPSGVGLPVETFGNPSGSAPVIPAAATPSAPVPSSTIRGPSATQTTARTNTPRVTTTTRTATTPTPVTQPATTAQYNKLNIPPVANYLSVDFNVPGKLVIPHLSIEAPIIWSKGEPQFDGDLEKGVIHLPTTAVPGSLGRAYISGHSSGYAWSAGNYKTVFAKLAQLPDNSNFILYVTDTNGKLITLKYTVYKRGEFTPADPAQFANTAESEVALGTCWPIGGTAKRMVIIGKLVEIKR